MKIFKYIIIAALGLLLAMTSCSDGNEINRVLTVDELPALLTKDAQSATVKVTIDAGVKFTAEWDGESWGGVVANVDEGLVTITIQANTTPNPRKASVIVSSEKGLRKSIIKVTQNGDTPLLSVVPDEIAFTLLGGEVIVDVASNVVWELATDAVWLDAKPYGSAGKVVVKVGENMTIYSRSTTMTFTAGTSSKEVSVRQDAGLSILIPYLDLVDASLMALEEFERARYSYVPEGGRLSYAKTYSVLTRSRLMPMVEYFFLRTNIKQLEFAATAVDDRHMPDFFPKGDDMGRAHDFMIAHEFEHLLKNGNSEYYWMDMGPDSPLHYQIEVDAGMKYVRYGAQATKPDPGDMPTVSSFPYKPGAIAWGSHKDEAIIWEVTNGATLVRNETQILHFNVLDAGNPLYQLREYVYKTADNDLSMVTHVLADNLLSMIYIKTTAGYMLNPKLDALFLKEGFTFKAYDIENYSIYENVAKELEVRAYITQLPGTEYLGALAHFHVPAGGRSGAPEYSAVASPYLPVNVKVLRK